MQLIDINNQDVLGMLNEFLWFVDNHDLKFICLSSGHIEDREPWLNNEYRDRIMSMGRGHDGYPVVCKAFNLKDSFLKTHSSAPKGVYESFMRKYSELNYKMASVLAVRTNALCAVYPPDGFISWHNNANAAAYNVIFTWSQNGDGYWQHVDPDTGENIVINDKPGQWTCKAGYFGHYDDYPNKLVYHKAQTNCWRMTISYIFNRDEGGKRLWEMMKEDINTPT